MPIEETVGRDGASWCRQGKVRYLGLSKRGAHTIRRAHEVHPSRASDRVLPVDPRLEDGDPADCPGAGHRLRGLQPAGPRLPDRPDQALEDLAPDDFRRQVPRFQEENFEQEPGAGGARDCDRRSKGMLPSQLALAWVMAQGRRHRAHPRNEAAQHLEENVAALEAELSAAEIASLEEVMPPDIAAGRRYSEASMRGLNL